MSLLDKLKGHLRALRSRDWNDLRVSDLCLDSLFTSIRLSDGSVGVAMNYDLEGHTTLTTQQIDDTRLHLLSLLSEDPLLWECLEAKSDSDAQRALLVALLSALSAPLLADDEALKEQGLRADAGRLKLDAFSHLGATSVTVVGFGGYLEEALSQSWLQRVCCCDYLANDEGFRQRNPYPFQIAEKARERMEVVYDDGGRIHELIESADIVCMSASTLCNGSLESLLPANTNGRKVIILEGPSGGVLPGPLFERGVTHLVHNPVDVDFVDLSHRFSRQARLGLQRITSGRFIDIILPEQRTVRGAKGLALENSGS